jgi:hypothetical protein
LKKKIIIVAIIAIIIAGVAIVSAGNHGIHHGLAPNSGDCIPDGSGFTSFDGQGPGYGPGPAPNSHDGIPDGPGW